MKPLVVGTAMVDGTTADEDPADTAIAGDETSATEAAALVDEAAWVLATVVAITTDEAEPDFLPADRAATTPS